MSHTARRRRINLTLSGVLTALAMLVLFSQLGIAVFEYARHALAALTFPFPL